MTPNLHILQADDHTRELRGRADDRRRIGAGRASHEGEVVANVSIRRADGRDCLALDRLEQLEGRRLRLGPVLVAEVGGEVLAALPLDGGGGISDPFRRTGWLLELLERSRAQLGGARRAARPPLASLRWRRRSSSSTVT
jgi:hypothetical protein